MNRSAVGAGLGLAVVAAACGPDWDKLDPSLGGGDGGAGNAATVSSSSSSSSTGTGGCNPDDGRACTEDQCVDGVPQHTPSSPGTTCAEGGGTMCNGQGDCVECLDSADCTPPETCNAASQCSCETAETCASLQLSCGNADDGCGGTLRCDNAIQDGDETDVDCGGGGGCLTKCANGEACLVASDCTSNFCVDGVCCQAACAATCMACNVANSLGTCVNTPQLQPDANGTMTCTVTLACDGMGACKKANGQMCAMPTECASGTCTGGTCV